ncbi:P-loop containing nucleoside triphosphate hydrolase protein [Mycena vulgaris]|nr:P-loop containing nucleoside triphosphate hydrolase protein [Mycena vulgaris]
MLPRAGDMISENINELQKEIQLAVKMLSPVTVMYNLVDIKNAVVDGNLDTPTFSSVGMSLTMENVSFSYPGNKSNNGAQQVDDVSFSIQPGQLVVIVGANGSGKSTLLNLLLRLYDPTSGKVMLNGEDIRNYRLADLHGATAVLTQDHYIYPLSLAENISIGNPEQVSSEDLVQQSARKGRADTFISKLSEGYDTMLTPTAALRQSADFSYPDTTPLFKIYKTFEKGTDVSGGERQRVVAARTFMRLTSNQIKLVVADEPSSNLDPRGEWELFQNLLSEREGKTMIFVTHRFGHLTKHADLILCIKDGRLIEQGTHNQLMAAKGEDGEHGEYYRLYEIQARAFTNAAEETA